MKTIMSSCLLILNNYELLTDQKRMKTNIYTLIALCVVLICACNGTKSDENNMNVIEIDLNQAKQISFTEWFDSVQIMPLETNSQSLIGNIDKVIFNGDLIYLLDGKFQNVLIFDNCGKFIKNTSHLRGQGPNEYISMTDIGIDEKGDLLILDPYSYKVRGYNANLEPASERDIPKDLLPIGEFKPISNDLYIFNNNNYNDDELFNVFSIKENKVIKKICSIENGGDAKKMIITRNTCFYRIDDIACFIPGFPHNQVYYYDSVKVEFLPRMEFKIKQNEFSSNKLRKNQDDSYYVDILKSGDYAFIIDIKETDRYYFLSIRYGKETYISRYDKETGENQVIERPFLEGHILLSQMLIKDNAFYMFVDASTISHEIRYSKNLSEKYKVNIENISEDDNPYIIKYFIKD